jgi:hypothetical protein
MSTIEEVRASEKKLKDLVNALKRAGAEDPDNLSAQSQTASDEYAKAARNSVRAALTLLSHYNST